MVEETGEPGENHQLRLHRKFEELLDGVLEGKDVGVLWSYVVEETGEPGENHQLRLHRKFEELQEGFSKARMLVFCGHTWWRKLENPGKTTNLGQTTTTLPHADTGI